MLSTPATARCRAIPGVLLVVSPALPTDMAREGWNALTGETMKTDRQTDRETRIQADVFSVLDNMVVGAEHEHLSHRVIEVAPQAGRIGHHPRFRNPSNYLQPRPTRAQNFDPASRKPPPTVPWYGNPERIA